MSLKNFNIFMHFCILFALLLHKEAHIIIMYWQIANCQLLAICDKNIEIYAFLKEGAMK